MRLSLSGDGCGESWPLCNEGFVPEGLPAWIEWIHRFSSGLALLLILFLWLLSRKLYLKNQAPRFFGFWSLVFILIEALIGAVLVLSGLVALNTNPIRIFVLAVHSVNSFLLVGSLVLVCKSSLCQSFLREDSSLKSSLSKKSFALKDQITFNKPLIYFVLAFPLLALTGNIASLAGQLFPTQSLSSALALDLLPSAHLSLKIRPLHPLLAGLFLIVLTRLAFNRKKLWLPLLATALVVLIGFVALISLSPLSMKLFHLASAYSLAVFLVWRSVNIKS